VELGERANADETRHRGGCRSRGSERYVKLVTIDHNSIESAILALQVAVRLQGLQIRLWGSPQSASVSLKLEYLKSAPRTQKAFVLKFLDKMGSGESTCATHNSLHLLLPYGNIESLDQAAACS
jgi:hypothetical protein